jgi:hypothetical protein
VEIAPVWEAVQEAVKLRAKRVQQGLIVQAPVSRARHLERVTYFVQVAQLKAIAWIAVAIVPI